MVLSNLKPGQSCYSILVYKNINKYFEYIIHFFIYFRYISGTSWLTCLLLNTGGFKLFRKMLVKEAISRDDCLNRINWSQDRLTPVHASLKHTICNIWYFTNFLFQTFWVITLKYLLDRVCRKIIWIPRNVWKCRWFLIGAWFVSFLMVFYLWDHWYDWLNFGLFNA